MFLEGTTRCGGTILYPRKLSPFSSKKYRQLRRGEFISSRAKGEWVKISQCTVYIDESCMCILNVFVVK